VAYMSFLGGNVAELLYSKKKYLRVSCVTTPPRMLSRAPFSTTGLS
jgi:hypothetical protein